MEVTPVMHILDKNDYSKHRLISLPSHILPPLAPYSLRIQSRILGLTTNNLTYAKLGFLLGWWDVYPQPANTPAPYNDHSTYGRVSAWGYAEILESTVSGISAGQTVFGYLPISTLPEDVQVKNAAWKDQIVVTNPYRQHLWEIYNRYQICAPLQDLETSKSLEDLGWDALMQVLFGTSYNLNTYGFAWVEKNLIHPSGTGEWTLKDAELHDATVVCLSASGKTGMAFAYQLRHNRPVEHQPKAVIAVCSEASKAMTEKSGFYDKVLLYSDAEAAKKLIAENGSQRVVLLDFGARTGATKIWNEVLSTVSVPFTFVGVGGEVKAMKAEDVAKMMQQLPNRIQVNANLLREKGIEIGGEEYLQQFHNKFDEFKAAGGIPSLSLKWAEGMEAWAEGWEKLCKDEVRADTGLVYRL